ncbi:MAG: hypothetical protein HY823_09150 [Acidobacteria bacterium]|nr:hypothetical protein [Acidobacteriota bacterium]
MRPILALPALLLPLACGSAKLEKATADKLIKPDYPAPVVVKVPLSATADKGSAKQERFRKINELLNKDGWFEIKESEKDGKVRYSYAVSPKAPKTVRPGLDNILAQAATAEFVGSTRMEPMDPRRKDGPVKVTFLVKFTKPTPLWPVYALTHEGVRLDQPMERHAQFERSGGKWGLLRTDETALLKD